MVATLVTVLRRALRARAPARGEAYPAEEAIEVVGEKAPG